MRKSQLKQIIQEEIQNFIKEVEVFGQQTAIPLSKIDAKTAKAAFNTGKKDGSEEDDASSVNSKDKAVVGSLKPMQKEVIPDKALAFALGFLRDGTPDLNNMEAIISSDDYIMDGHHRWAAHTLINPLAQVGVATIDMPADDLITTLNIYTKAKGLKGNPGRGDVTKFASSIPKLLPIAMAKGTAGLPDEKGHWPEVSAEEVKTLLGKVPGAKGDAEKGKAIMIANAKKLNTDKHPNAPSRVDMPVIDAAKGDLKKVLAKVSAGEMDIKKPFTDSVSGLLKTKGDEDKESEEEIKESKRWQKLAGVIK
jgi:hypothetical protein